MDGLLCDFSDTELCLLPQVKRKETSLHRNFACDFGNHNVRGAFYKTEQVVSMKDELVLKNRLKEIRKEQDLSQQKLADLVGVSRNTISSIETGQFNPTAKLALILCIALDKKFEEIFYF